MIFSVVIPVYRNEQSLPELIRELEKVGQQLPGELEVVFVVDASPDNSFEVLRSSLPAARIKSQLLLLSRNFSRRSPRGWRPLGETTSP
jgi:glycosyltransferase involved in cell wall biosynthesis